MIDYGLDYRRLRLDVALDRLDRRLWSPLNEDPLILGGVWFHLDGAYTFELLATAHDPEDVCVCRSTFVGGQLLEEWSAHGTVERMIAAVLALGEPPGLGGPHREAT